jgi:maltose O-acetyltransferase
MLNVYIGKIILKIENLKYRFVYAIFYKKYKLNNSFKFNGSGIQFYGEGEIIIGKNSYIGELSTIQATYGCRVIIGDNCQISHNVRMYTSTDISDQDFSNKLRLEKKGDVIIGDFVWIGANVFINPGITIGENSIIGANSVVTKNIDPFTIVGGVPAKLIRRKKSND